MSKSSNQHVQKKVIQEARKSDLSERKPDASPSSLKDNLPSDQQGVNKGSNDHHQGQKKHPSIH